MSGDTILVLSLINRLGSKLPCNTRRRLDAVKADPMVQQTVHALVELSKHRLSTVAHSLMTLLENINKSAVLLNDDGSPSVEILQSQLFLLKVLGACMSHHWRCCREKNADDHTGASDGDDGEYAATASRPVSVLHPAGNTSFPSLGYAQRSAAFSMANFDDDTTSSPTGMLDDPPPLDESLAKYILALVGKFLQVSAPDVLDGAVGENAHDLKPSASSTSLAASVSESERAHSMREVAISAGMIPGENALRPHNIGTGSASALGLFDGNRKIGLHHQHAADMTSDTRGGLTADVHRSAGRVLFYISASNWSTVFHRICQCIAELSSSPDENVDAGDLRLLEWCNLNSRRMSTVLQEFCTMFLQMKRNAQMLAAVVLRRAIWNWIEVYPKSFMQLSRSQKRLDGGPEILFDLCSGIADNSKRKAVFWPLQMMLLVLCPDIMMNIVLSDGAGSAKKAQFLDALRKSLKSSRLAEVSAITFVDLCKASTYVTKDDKSALWQLVPEIENELRDKLFDPEKPFVPEAGQTDLRLMTECFTALFRLNPRSTLRSLVPTCLSEKAPTIFRLALVRGCLAIASESYLTWNPNISSMYSALSGPLRQVIIDSTRDKSLPSMDAAPSKKNPFGRTASKPSKIDPVELQLKHDLVLSIFKLYRTDPQLAVHCEQPSRQREDHRLLLTSITSWLRDPNPILRSNAAETLLALHDPNFIECWAPPGETMSAFWSISSQVLVTIARQLLEYRERDDAVKYILELCQQLLLRRNTFIQRHLADVHVGMTTPDRLAASVALEVALLILLCSAEPEVCSTAVNCFGHMCTEAELTEEVEDPAHAQLTIVENYESYYELGTSVGVLIPGKVAQQKRIRRMLRGMECQTPGNLAAWEEAYRRWRISTQAMTKSSIDEEPSASPAHHDAGRDHSTAPHGRLEVAAPAAKRRPFLYGLTGGGHTAASASSDKGSVAGSDRSSVAGRNAPNVASGAAVQAGQQAGLGLDSLEDRGEWNNYTGFLCALGGICAPDPNNTDRAVADVPQLSRSTSVRRPVAGSDSARMIDRFLHEMVDLLVCDSVVVREIVQQTLGNDLSPALYATLFRHLEAVVDRFFDKDGQAICSDRYTQFVEQAISVLKLILDRMQDSSASILAVDFGGLIHSFARYIHRLGNGTQALRIKIKMCQLCELLMARKDFLGLRQEIKLRNMLLDLIVEWTTDFARKDAPNADRRDTNPSRESNFGNIPGDDTNLAKNEKLHRDLDQACMKTAVSLLSQLPLQPLELKREDYDMSIAKSRVFYKYFTFFLKVLHRCRVLETIDTGSHAQRNNAELQSLISKSKEYVKDLGPLKDYTILALSNLLSANIESGLKYSLSMGYHEDSKTRTAFMQVLTNILYQGTEFESLAENVKNSRYEKLVDSLMENDMAVALSLSEVAPASDIDSLGTLLLQVAEYKQLSMAFLKALIESEISRTEIAAELFRRNSMATRVIMNFARLRAFEYLRVTLQPLLMRIVNSAEKSSFELDPTKLTAGADAARNLSNLKIVSQLFLDEIIKSASRMPQPIREICHFIYEAVAEKFPEARATAVGGFIFLRFFCPSIVAPDSANLMPPIEDREIRRGLLLVTKVILNLANKVLFGTKEAFMVPLNDLLSAYMSQVEKFLTDISVKTEPASDVRLDQEVRRLEDSDMNRVHRFLVTNQDKIGRDLNSRKLAFRSSLRNMDVESVGSPLAAVPDFDRQLTTSKKAFEKLNTVLGQLGAPREEPKLPIAAAAAAKPGTINQMYREFMSRHANRDIEALSAKRMFYEGGMSRDRRPVFYYICRRVNIENVDMELLIYFILHTMEHAFGKPYELVIDLSAFGPLNEILDQWITQFLQVLPYDAEQNLAALFIHNASIAFKRYMKKSSRSFSNRLGKKVVFTNSLGELHEFISESELRLPKWTTSLEMDNGLTFAPVTKITQFKLPMPVTMKIYDEVILLRKQDILGLSAVFCDVYKVAEIEDSSIISHRNEDSAVVLKYDRGNATMTFCSPKADQMFQAIRAARARLELSKPVGSIAERRIRPSDVPGSLMNMALLNMGSDDANLRLAAYHLLYALCVTFDFDVGKQLLSAKGLCIPGNSNEFIRAISEKLARSECQLTIELLQESFVSYHKSSVAQKNLTLEYIAPWLANLAKINRRNFDDLTTVKKTRDILRQLIELTVKEPELFHVIQSKIWGPIGSVDEVVCMILDSFVQFCVEHGMGSLPAEIIANTMITLQSVTVRGRVIARLRRVIGSTSLKPPKTLTDHSAWGEIAVLIRFLLMMSFNNRLHVQQYLPELFHIVSVLSATGPAIIRASIHGIVINAVHSLFTSQQLPESQRRALSLQLAELSEPKTRLLFGMNRVTHSAFARTAEAIADMPETMPLGSLESVVHMLLDIMAYGGLNMDMSNGWRARWMSLVTSTAFQHNPAIQPRAFIVLGCLARDEVDDDLLYQILVALKSALTHFDEGDCNLIVSIIMCLTSIAENLTADCRYLHHMFWLSMAVMHIGHVPLFPSALNLMEVVLRNLHDNGFFLEESVSDFLMRNRVSIDDTSDKAFQSSFSFAVSALILKGLKHPFTVTSTSSALSTILQISCKPQLHSSSIDPDVLGYLAPLLPQAAKNNEIRELLWTAGVYEDIYDGDDSDSSDGSYVKVFRKLTIPDEKTAILLLSVMVTLLNHAEFETEQLFLYGFLAEAAQALPEVFVMFYENLLPKMNQVLGSSQAVAIIEAVQSILYTMVSSPAVRNKHSLRAPLSELAFGHLPDCGSFQKVTPAQKRTYADLAGCAVEKMIM